MDEIGQLIDRGVKEIMDDTGTFPVGDRPWGIAFDGANMWVTNPGDNTVSKL